MSMMKEPIRVLITGAGGQIGYSLVYIVSSGYVFGDDQPIILHLLEIPAGMQMLEGVYMELQDSHLPLIHSIVTTDKLEEAFADIDAAFLVGSFPWKEGMVRKDLLAGNSKIFKEQGEALDKYAKKTVKVEIVSNPANTNAFICSKFAPSIPACNISAMTRLDQNRGKGFLAEKLKTSLCAINNPVIWGNHSGTMFPDMSRATVRYSDGGKILVEEALGGNEWLRGEFMKTVQFRAFAIFEARKRTSGLSAAKAACDHMRDWWLGTNDDEFVSMVVQSDGSYGVTKGLFFSFPVRIKNREWKIVDGWKFDDWGEKMMKTTMKDLEEERDIALASV